MGLCLHFLQTHTYRLTIITISFTTINHLKQGLGMKLGPALRLRAALSKRLGNCPHCRHCKHCHDQEEK